MNQTKKSKDSLLSDKQKLELDERMDEYISGIGKNYSWSRVVKKIKSRTKNISGK